MCLLRAGVADPAQAGWSAPPGARKCAYDKEGKPFLAKQLKLFSKRSIDYRLLAHTDGLLVNSFPL